MIALPALTHTTCQKIYYSYCAAKGHCILKGAETDVSRIMAAYYQAEEP